MRLPLAAWIGGPRLVHAGPLASFAGGLAGREPGQRSPWRLTRRVAGFVLRPVGGVAWTPFARFQLGFRRNSQLLSSGILLGFFVPEKVSLSSLTHQGFPFLVVSEERVIKSPSRHPSLD